MTAVREMISRSSGKQHRERDSENSDCRLESQLGDDQQSFDEATASTSSKGLLISTEMVIGATATEGWQSD
jgi:hypothetical protein